jgi:hypothetical protein
MKKTITNNRKMTKGRQFRKQTIMSEPAKIKTDSVILPNGEIRNYYRINPNAKPVKTISHIADSWL